MSDKIEEHGHARAKGPPRWFAGLRANKYNANLNRFHHFHQSLLLDSTVDLVCDCRKNLNNKDDKFWLHCTGKIFHAILYGSIADILLFFPFYLRWTVAQCRFLFVHRADVAIETESDSVLMFQRAPGAGQRPHGWATHSLARVLQLPLSVFPYRYGLQETKRIQRLSSSPPQKVIFGARSPQLARAGHGEKKLLVSLAMCFEIRLADGKGTVRGCAVLDWIPISRGTDSARQTRKEKWLALTVSWRRTLAATSTGTEMQEIDVRSWSFFCESNARKSCFCVRLTCSSPEWCTHVRWLLGLRRARAFLNYLPVKSHVFICRYLKWVSII